jgi:protein phosphatase
VLSLQYEFAARSDKGLVRSGNEDSFGTHPGEGIVVVADGMGGYRAGEVASRIAVETVLHHLIKQVPKANLERCLDEVERAIEQANKAIWKAVQETPDLQSMGTTVVVGIFRDGGLGFAWVGDSRLYLLREHCLVQLTTDHTLVQELVNQHLFPSVTAAMNAGVGEHVLVRALGAEDPLMVDVGNVELAVGDIVLFCSDGLNHMVDNRAIERILNTPRTDLKTKVDQLIQLACDAGGRDNITVVLTEVLAADG